LSSPFTTTVVAELLLALSWREENVTLRVLRFGGRLGNRYYPFYAYHECGSTKDTVWTTVAEVVDERVTEGNIGYPIANHQVYVLNRNQNRVPVGEVGEIYVLVEWV
jgi:non-ribosomal peptide synthetase component F